MKDWDEIKAICDKATKGEWLSMKYPPPSLEDHGFRLIASTSLGKEIGVFARKENMAFSVGQRRADSDFISVARTALPEAIAEIEQLRTKHDNQLQYSVLLGEENKQLRQDKAELEKQLNKILDNWD